MRLTDSQLAELSRTEINKIDRSTLADIKEIKLDPLLPLAERMTQYLEQIKNPYCFLCGKTPVKVRFADAGKTLDEAVKDHFMGLKSL